MIAILEDPFDPLDALREHEQRLGERKRRIGACATFTGSMRDFNEGEQVSSMVLEHYPGMTEQHLEQIAGEATSRWALDEVLVGPDAIESRAAALFALLRSGNSSSLGASAQPPTAAAGQSAAAGQAADAGFWQLIAALCVEERRRRLAMRRLRQLDRENAQPSDHSVSALAEERVRAQRACVHACGGDVQ